MLKKNKDVDMFQSTPPHGGRLCLSELIKLQEGFNPRPRTGGDIVQLGYLLGNYGFNPRPRTGGDQQDFLLRHLR